MGRHTHRDQVSFATFAENNAHYSFANENLQNWNEHGQCHMYTRAPFSFSFTLPLPFHSGRLYSYDALDERQMQHVALQLEQIETPAHFYCSRLNGKI